MKIRIQSFFLAVLMLCMTVLTAWSDVMVVKAAEDLVLKVHYHREDNVYDDWSVWLWEFGGEGGDFAFAEEDGEMVATKVVTPGVTTVGFIVRTPDWGKDINKDQFIDISEMVSGTVHIYVESGIEGYTKEYGDDAVTGTKVSSAKYDGEVLKVQMTGNIDGDLHSAFTVKGKEGKTPVAEVTESDKFQYTVTLSEALNPAESYTLVFDSNEYKITMPDYYSTEEFEFKYTYAGDDLGATWTAEKTAFRVWAPTADEVKVNLYASGNEGAEDLLETLTMTQDVNGTWTAEKDGDLNGVYYTYSVTIDDAVNEACDPYARTTGANGKRAMIIDLASTNPEGWDADKDPHADAAVTDAVIYELHVRDLSSDASSGIKNVGKFLGLIETGTKTASGIPTGLDHIKDLGITHLHLLPSYDYGSVDETTLERNQFNWGYDPVNYNVPEGSYSTDPFNGDVRVKEMKQMVKGLHDNGISVVMDVVYNHVQDAAGFCFNKIVPGYFSRIDENGQYSGGSGCGNDVASERAMVKKYIVDSVSYWAEEYHIDGFRFDLVGLIDTETINAIIEEVHKDHPNVIFYGEGWTMDTKMVKEGYTLTTQLNSTETPEFAFFSDTIRDALKGSVFENTEKGFVSGAAGKEDVIAKCFMGLAPDWCTNPSQSVNYASCHDNMTLMDRITRSTTGADRADRVRMNNLAAAVYMTSEGIPFIHAGEEMLRSKVKGDGTFEENSYKSSDNVNSLKWDTLNEEEYKNVFEYYKGLIAFRKAHGALRLTTAEEVNANVKQIEGVDTNVVAMQINGGVNGETADSIFVIFNANPTETTVTLPEGNWNVCINGEKAGTETIETINGSAVATPISAMILVQDNEMEAESSVQASTEAPADTEAGQSSVWPVAAAAAAVIAAVIGVVVFKKKKNK